MDVIYAGVTLTGPTMAEKLSKPFELPGKAALDVVQLCRAKHVYVRPMGNREQRVTPRFRRQFTSYLEAAEYVAGFEKSLPDQGQLVLREADSTNELTISIANAAIESWQPVRDGVGVWIDCGFVFGGDPGVSLVALPATEATWATWNEATWENLGDRIWPASQAAV